MRFHAPDSMSPFGAGGVNPYAYCSGDPINNSDPSGHMNRQAPGRKKPGFMGISAAAEIPGADFAIGIVRSMVTVIESKGAAASTSFYTKHSVGPQIRRIDNHHENGRINPITFAMRDGDERLNNALRFIDNDNNFNHQFYPDDGGISVSQSRLNNDIFKNYFSEETWQFNNNSRVESTEFYASDMAIYQRTQIAYENGNLDVMPKKIIRHLVTNDTTVSLTNGLHGDALARVFLNDTPNGKTTKRIMDYYGLNATSVKVKNYGNMDSYLLADYEVNLR